MEIKKIEYGSDLYQQSIDLRQAILRDPLGLHLNQDDLLKEKNDIHLAAVDSNKVLAILILTDKGDGIVKMRQVAVSLNLQGQGMGSLLVKAAENIARQNGYHMIILEARSTALRFYEKLGYEIEGDEFDEPNIHIPHYKMKKKL